MMDCLIENVKKHPCLWDVNSEDYKDIEMKRLAWQMITKECRCVHTKKARTLWKNLRDGHRQALFRQKVSRKKWKYEDQMSFLLPYMSARPRRSYYSLSDDDIKKQAQQTEESNEAQNYQKKDSSGIVNEQRTPSIRNLLLEKERKEEEQRKKKIEERKRDIELKIAKEKIKIRNMKEKLIKKRQSRDSTSSSGSDKTDQKKALETFFRSMFKTTSNLPETLQVRVQRQVFNVVMEAHEEHLAATKSVNAVPGQSTLEVIKIESVSK